MHQLVTWTYPNAQEWARQHSLADVPRLARLEGFAFQDHPEIVAGFGEDGAAMAASASRPPRTPARFVRGLLLVLISVVGAGAPLAGVAFLASGMRVFTLVDPFSAEFAVPAAGVSFVLSALTQLVLGVAWLWSGRFWSPVTFGVALTAAVLAVPTLLMMPVVAQRDGVPVGPWAAPVGIALVLAAVLALAVRLRRRHEPPMPPPPVPARLTVHDREHARLRVAELDQTEQRRIRADRDAALGILQERGLLDEAEASRARDADLGTLFTLDPLRAG